ncbi:hypothetical protein HK105_208446 [Polyrhizophydium stewartii]|uniref:Cyclic nucleotide-binding domain-containing protein n=1 Tax=Polyrhizophydium stewartii TaxID=2732419 RepID=A0ABR4MXZ2_9FUNG
MRTLLRRLVTRDIYAQPRRLAATAGISRSLLAISTVSRSAIHPHSLFSQVWASLIFAVRVAMSFLLPLSLGFGELENILRVITIPFCIFSIVDMAIVSHTGLILERRIEMDASRLVRTYALSPLGLWFDLATCLPWVFLIDTWTPHHHGDVESAQPAHRVWRMLCLVHVLPCIKQGMSDRISLVSENVKRLVRLYNIPSTAVSLSSVVAIMFMYWHWAACAVSLLKELGTIPFTNEHEPLIDRYTIGFYSSAAEMLAAGFGAEEPTVTADRWLKVCNMLISALFSAVFVGNISSFIIGLDSTGRMFNQKLEEVSQYISYKGFGGDIKRRLLEYYRFKYSQGKFFDEKQILAELNHPLRQDICMQECQSLILKVPFFKDADHFFITQVVMILHVTHYMPGDYVIEEGNIGDNMFFIASGTLEVIVGGTARAKLSPGLFFGEIALLYGRMRRTASVRAVTNCILYSLSRPDLNTVLECNPKMADKMRKVAEERLAADAKFRPLASHTSQLNVAGPNSPWMSQSSNFGATSTASETPVSDMAPPLPSQGLLGRQGVGAAGVPQIIVASVDSVGSGGRSDPGSGRGRAADAADPQ